MIKREKNRIKITFFFFFSFPPDPHDAASDGKPQSKRRLSSSARASPGEEVVISSSTSSPPPRPPSVTAAAATAAVDPVLEERCNSEDLRHVSCRLETKDLWDKFNELGTEMIITKTGRSVYVYVYARKMCFFFFKKLLYSIIVSPGSRVRVARAK